ncbi:hypothetical protein [Endozoicomonas euniceicola]|uniref:Uncharacterized protein n=1 Tax=Endozoicomonas euniceicola TaxID=1234143 RepID=A0ABY6GQB4_9GAMM|nr:hypothetical protein [Endozoicomonas euniceicola]UYM14589.1 hypothetical protein NX720_17050 [Endozoicomonas euniceicola]
MKFHDLMDIPYNQDTGCIDKIYLESKLTKTPEDVLQQLYHEHGRNFDFQSQYKEIDISEITWELQELQAEELLRISYYHEFSPWFEGVLKRPESFKTRGWDCIDTRQEIREFWSQYNTWLTSPIVFDNSVYSIGLKYHLVEGHTRVALLKGLIQNGVLSKETKHKVWIGTAKIQ